MNKPKLAAWGASLAVAFLIAFTVLSLLNGNSAPRRLWTTPPDKVTYMAKDVSQNGKVVTMVGTTRTFGYRIGDIMPVRILVITEPGVEVSFEGLRSGIITLGSSDFEMVGNASIKHYKSQGKSVWQVDLAIRHKTWPPADTLSFSADFYIAVDRLSNGAPDWLPQSTPDVSFTIVKTAPDNADKLNEGDLADRPGGSPDTGWFFIALGAISGMVLPLWVLHKIKHRKRRTRPLSAEELAWLFFDKVFDENKTTGWQLRHSQLVSFALRHYLDADHKTTRELSQVDFYHPQRARILSVLDVCDRHLYFGKAPDAPQVEKLVQDIALIVPRTAQ